MRIFSVALTMLILGCFSYYILKSNIKAELEEEKNEQIFVRLPNAYFWVGLVGAMFCLSPFILTPIFPDVFVGGTLWVWIFFSLCILLFIIMMIEVKIWRIEVYKDKDYFIYRTWLGRTHVIKYEECENYKETTNTLVLKTNKKTFYIDRNAINFDVFMKMLLKFEVKKMMQYRMNSRQVYVRLPNTYFWIGLVSAVFFVSPLIFVPLFPDFFEEKTIYEWLWVLPFSLLGVFLMIEVKIWRIEVYKDKDYFIYRTWLGRTHIIKYEECRKYKKIIDYLVLKTNKKTFYIDRNAINFDVFMKMLLKFRKRQ